MLQVDIRQKDIWVLVLTHVASLNNFLDSRALLTDKVTLEWVIWANDWHYEGTSVPVFCSRDLSPSLKVPHHMLYLSCLTHFLLQIES